MSSQPPDFKIDAPPEFSAKIASIFAQFKEIEKQREETSQSRDKGNSSSVQKEDPTVLRDDEFAIPRIKLQLDRRNTFSPSSSGAPRRRPPFEFKRPRIPPPPKSKIPDHKLHPEKWTKYSLASVDESQMSDGANTAAAMAYLKQQERRSQGQALWDEDAQLLDLRAKVMFHGKKKKPDRLKPKFFSDHSNEVSGSQNSQADEAGGDSTRPSFGTNLRTLVENRSDDHRKIALSHLQDADGDDDEGDAMTVDENTDNLQSESVADEGSSSSNHEGPPKSKKLKRALRPCAEAVQSNEAALDDKPS